jgi:LEA14-like dessication related protein
MSRFPGRTSLFHIAAILSAVLTLTCCASLGGYAHLVEPEVDVTDVKVLGTTLTGADLLFQFEVDNPNAVALVLQGIGYRVRLNDEPLLDGRRDEEMTIAANGRSVIELPVTLRFEDVYRIIRSFEGREKPDYALDADFRFDVPILGAVTVPVTKRGEIPLDRLRRAIGM